jgi:uncharacterized protein
MNEFDGHWITTLHVKKFHYLDPQPDEIDIRDIAHALSMTCRFGGHCSKYYSVAEHSVRMAWAMVGKNNVLSTLLHDAAEAYIPDIPKPIKEDYPQWKDMEIVIEEAILTKFDAFGGDWEAIKVLDSNICLAEAFYLGLDITDWYKPSSFKLIGINDIGWSPKEAEQNFLDTFTKVTGRAKIYV